MATRPTGDMTQRTEGEGAEPTHTHPARMHSHAPYHRLASHVPCLLE